jgi:hypothetical protein
MKVHLDTEHSQSTKSRKRTVNTLIRLILLNVIEQNAYSLVPFCWNKQDRYFSRF